MKNHLSESEKGVITEKIASFLISSCNEIVAAYVLGSFVNPGPFSDIDIGIITIKKRDRTLEFEIELETRLEDIIRYPVDVRILNQAPLSFCQTAIRFGKVIVDRNPNLRADFEGQILKRYFDFYRFRSRYLKDVVNAPI